LSVLLTANPTTFRTFDRRLAIDSGYAEHGGVAGQAVKLEAAFDAIYGLWRETALTLQTQPSAELAHMPTMSTYASDFGNMLAWLRVVEDLAKEPTETCVLCPDPWLYRALSLLPGVSTDPSPNIAAKRLRFFCRGLLARTRAALRCIVAHWQTRSQRQSVPVQASWLLVYGHPESTAEGNDAYFSTLMTGLPSLQRIMHTDCSASFALKLARDGRTRSLHAWGNVWTALTLPIQKWRPDVTGLDPKIAWLVRRAAAIEGSGGSAAMTRWQMICHAAWLKAANPIAVSWPWENHPWERDFVRQSRRHGTNTLGYQHTVVGRHMYNQGAESNLDGLASIPDLILLNGPAYQDDLNSRGIPETRMAIAGSHRIGARKLPRFAKDGPVFLALSNNPQFAEQMIRAARPLASAAMPFIVKDHPLSPYPVSESAHFSYTRAAIADLPPLRTLVYCTGTTGLEGLLGGIPTLRFIPEGGIALDILPAGMQVASASAASFAETLNALPVPVRHDVATLFPAPDTGVWKTLLNLT
jgi:hypothetical protein